MLQALIKFFLALGLGGTLAVTVATAVYSYFEQYGNFDGCGWNVPSSVAGVPEISAGHAATVGLLLMGGVALVTAARRSSSADHSDSNAAQAS